MTRITRRRFLERTSAAAAAVWGLADASAHAAGMFVSLNGALTAGKNLPWPELARLAARTGYGGVDWSLGPAKAAGLVETKRLFDALQIKPTIVNLPLTGPFAGDEELLKQKLPELADDAAFSAGVGCSKMMLVLPAASAQPKDEYRKIVRDRLALIAAVLARFDIRLGLEFLGPLYMRAGAPNPCPGRGGAPPAGPRLPFIWTLPETLALARDSGPNVGAILDAWHWHHSGGTVADILAAGASGIVHVHVSDARQAAAETVCDSPRLMPGEGIIDLTGFFQALKKIGYEGGVSPEPLGRVPMEMSADDAAKLGLETTIVVMKKAGII